MHALKQAQAQALRRLQPPEGARRSSMVMRRVFF
jgi:hypothetical protein